MRLLSCLLPIASLILPGTGQIFSGCLIPGLIFFGAWLALGHALAAVSSSLGADARHAVYFAGLACEVLLRLGSAIDVVFRQRSQVRGLGGRQLGRAAIACVFCVLLLVLVAVPAPEPVLKAYAVNSNRSKLPSIALGSRVLVDVKAYQTLKPQKNDIVVVSPRNAVGEQAITRPIIGKVEGIAGECVQVPFVSDVKNGGDGGKTFRECIVPEGDVYLLALNLMRQVALFAPLTNVVGRVEYVYWPLSQIGRVRSRTIEADSDANPESEVSLTSKHEGDLVTH
ncbi:MAG: hypothetical protein QM579_12695 [Desulfovibrio sp.]|uniref:hypothetical protein n=1 Tax=Desulfovibrio sp. TaxID=885 RepID=UPI0039E65CDB